MTRNDDARRDDAMLDDFFAAGRAEAPVPSADLLARISADAAAQAARNAPARQPRRRRGLFATISEAIGGWPALAGLASAAAAGVWIGVAQPTALAAVTGGLIGTTEPATYELEALIPGYSLLSSFSEGVAP
jgi:hypothetical protein